MKNKPEKNTTAKNKAKTEPDAPINDALQASYQKIVELRLMAARGDTETSYAIGVEVELIKNDEEKYGARSVENIATRLNCTPALLYGYGTVARRWPQQEFNGLLTRMNKYGLPLTFSHFVEVAKVDDVETRSALLDSALEHGWSVRDLRAALPKRQAPRGDTVDVAKYLVQMLAVYTSVLEKAAAHQAALEGLAPSVAPDRVPSDEQFNTLFETLTKLVKQAEGINAIAKELHVTWRQASTKQDKAA